MPTTGHQGKHSFSKLFFVGSTKFVRVKRWWLSFQMLSQTTPYWSFEFRTKSFCSYNFLKVFRTALVELHRFVNVLKSFAGYSVWNIVFLDTPKGTLWDSNRCEQPREENWKLRFRTRSVWLALIYSLIGIIKLLKSHDLIQQQILHDAENVRVTRLSILPIMH